MSPPGTGQSYPISIDPIYFCWLWTSRIDKDGYGLANGSKLQMAHRWVYEQEIGPIPDGLMLEHWCRVRSCCNPNHLEPTTQSVNERRKNWRHRSRMRHCCKKGHDKFKHGIRTRTGGIVCRICE